MIKKLIQRYLLKLAENEKAKARARALFVHFPKLKYRLVGLAYGNAAPRKKIKYVYKDDFLEVIKLEVENRRDSLDT